MAGSGFPGRDVIILAHAAAGPKEGEVEAGANQIPSNPEAAPPAPWA